MKPEDVTKEWLREKMRGRRVKCTANALGIHPGILSKHQCGRQPISAVAKAAYFFYFKQFDL